MGLGIGLHGSDSSRVRAEALRILGTSWTITEEPPEPTPLILDLIE